MALPRRSLKGLTTEERKAHTAALARAWRKANPEKAAATARRYREKDIEASRAKARDARRISDVKNIQLALSLYYSDNGYYPLDIYCQASTCGGLAITTGLAPNYLPTVPSDPNYTVSNATCAATANTPGCYGYNAYDAGAVASCNTTSRVPSKYHLAAVLEDKTNAALNQDADAPTVGSGSMTGFSVCQNGSSDFDGTSVGDPTGITQCSSTAGTQEPGGTETCYDQTP